MFSTNDFYKFNDFGIGDCVVYIDTTTKKPKKKHGIMTHKNGESFVIHWEGSDKPTTFTRKEFDCGVACFCKKKDFKYLGGSL